MAQEVSPEEVENIAANVLNLSNSGSTLTPEQAELMLEFASAPAEATLLPVAMAPDGATPPTPTAPPTAPAPATPPTPIDPTRLAALAERLASMIAFDVEVHEAMADRQANRRDMARHIRYRVDQGLHIDIDAEMATAMTQRLASRVERLEKRKMIVWKQNMAEEMHADRERARHELRSVEALKKHPPRQVRMAMHHLESLKHLEALGYRPLLSDSLKQQITAHLEAALAGLGEQRVGVPADQEDFIEQHLDAVEELFDEIADSLDVLEEQEDEQR